MCLEDDVRELRNIIKKERIQSNSEVIKNVDNWDVKTYGKRKRATFKE